MTRARDIANLLGTNTNGIIDNAKITLDAAEVPNLAASKITSGTFADARIASSNVSQHATSFDDNKIVNDISTLAIRQASNENKTAYNTQSMFVDVFQDGSGIASHTTSVRNASEYVDTTTSSSANVTARGDGADIVLLQARGLSNGATSFSDTATNSPGATSFSLGGGAAASNEQALPGSSVSFKLDGSGDEIQNNSSSPSSSAFQGLGGETNICVQFWFYKKSGVDYSSDSILDVGQEIQMEFDSSTEKLAVYYRNVTVREQSACSDNAWHHVAWQKQGGTARLYIDGVQVDSGAPGGGITSGNLNDNIFRWGAHRSQSSRYFDGYVDMLRISAQNVFPNGTSFTPDSYGSTVLSATGNFISNAITAPSSTSKMGAIITYQDNAGTNTLNTDIVLQLSADNGSNFATATMTAMPDFASGIKMAKVNDLSVTAGTQLKYKISFANQASGSKEARIRGVSLQY
ncbi:LamG domain-containing protein [Candidatus Pelagibacter ubique]|nr:LamG domain-containing protein [Candidatus Pelagibacter ubique]